MCVDIYTQRKKEKIKGAQNQAKRLPTSLSFSFGCGDTFHQETRTCLEQCSYPPSLLPCTTLLYLSKSSVCALQHSGQVALAADVFPSSTAHQYSPAKAARQYAQKRTVIITIVLFWDNTHRVCLGIITYMYYFTITGTTRHILRYETILVYYPCFSVKMCGRLKPYKWRVTLGQVSKFKIYIRKSKHKQSSHVCEQESRQTSVPTNRIATYVRKVVKCVCSTVRGRPCMFSLYPTYTRTPLEQK